jgi:hypothetical protein
LAPAEVERWGEVWLHAEIRHECKRATRCLDHVLAVVALGDRVIPGERLLPIGVLREDLLELLSMEPFVGLVARDSQGSSKAHLLAARHGPSGKRPRRPRTEGRDAHDRSAPNEAAPADERPEQ